MCKKWLVVGMCVLASTMLFGCSKDEGLNKSKIAAKEESNDTETSSKDKDKNKDKNKDKDEDKATDLEKDKKAEEEEDKINEAAQKAEDEAREKEEAEKSEEVVMATGGVQPSPGLDAKTIAAANFGADDPLLVFKAEKTEAYLGRVSQMFSVLDERYGAYIEDPQGFNRVDEQSQLEYDRSILDYDTRYQYITEVEYGLYFNDDTDSNNTFEDLRLTLCDDDKDGKIELNDAAKTILTTFYKDIDLEATQACINQSIENEKVQSYDYVALENTGKYWDVDFDWYRYEDNPVEIEIAIQTYTDYPRE
ncbi:MAG: hypothetical protein ACRDDX_11835 [Cellulosilyticaceae bacterium]